MSDDPAPVFSREARRYVLLVEFLLRKEEEGQITTKDALGLLAEDGELYRNYCSMIRGGKYFFPPERAVETVAKITALLADSHPDIGEQASLMVSVSDRDLQQGLDRYIRLVAFLEKKKEGGELGTEEFEKLMSVDRSLFENYLGMNRGDTGVISGRRGHVAAAAIERQLAVLQPELAQEFQSRSNCRSL
jgi:hypothetical protein